jgi:hypothetical protein
MRYAALRVVVCARACACVWVCLNVCSFHFVWINIVRLPLPATHPMIANRKKDKRHLLLENRRHDDWNGSFSFSLFSAFHSCCMFMLQNEIFITQNDVWQALVVTLFWLSSLSIALLWLSAFSALPIDEWDTARKCLHLYREKKHRERERERRTERLENRDWSSSMIGRKLIALCNCGQVIGVEIERQLWQTIFFFRLVNICLHLVTTREERKKSIYHLSGLPLLRTHTIDRWRRAYFLSRERRGRGRET